MTHSRSRSIFRFVPDPFNLALILTAVTAVGAFIVMPAHVEGGKLVALFGYWYKGLWELLAFAMQMVMILVLGHVIALSPIVEKFLTSLSSNVKGSAASAVLIGLSAMIGAWINWGFGLILGAILARKIAENARRQGLTVNYPLLAAAGYSGLMVWHGGLSGSATLVVAEPGHFLEQVTGVLPLGQTTLSIQNLLTSIAVLLVTTSVLYIAGRRTGTTALEKLPLPRSEEEKVTQASPRATWTSRITGLLILMYPIYLLLQGGGIKDVNLNFVNTILFGLGLLLHPGLYSFTRAAGEAVRGSVGIILQFPLYAGIMGLMQYSGLTEVMTQGLVSLSTPATFPLMVLLSAAIVNFLVPSGGGQWAVQGPLLMTAAVAIGANIPHSILAFAYGDELTNMMQPFWALPLLGITGVKAREILPYTLLMMLGGAVVYSLSAYFGG